MDFPSLSWSLTMVAGADIGWMFPMGDTDSKKDTLPKSENKVFFYRYTLIELVLFYEINKTEKAYVKRRWNKAALYLKTDY